MDIDFNTLAWSYGIPKWWLETNFDKNTDKTISSYMATLQKQWKEQSIKIRRLGWFIPDFEQIKKKFFEISAETRPCHDCKKDVCYNDVAFNKCFPWKDMPEISEGVKHFNLFILCKICASKEHVIPMTNSPQKAVEQQLLKSKRQLLLESELVAEHEKYVRTLEDLGKLKHAQEELDREIELHQPLVDKLEEAKAKNDEIREQLKQFEIDTEKVTSKLKDCSQIGTTILDALSQFSQGLKETTEKLEEVTDCYEETFTNEKKCGVCWSKIDVYVALKPCNHVYCQKCSHNAHTCPSCTKVVENREVIFHP